MRKSIIRCLLAALATLPLGVAQAGDPEAGKKLVAACGGCHGATGVSKIPAMPSIAGFDPAYFVDDMLAFKHGDMESPMMVPFAKPYSREQMEDMAAFYAQQDWVPAPQKFDPAKAEKGKKLHEQYCGMCHMDGGSMAAAREWSMAPLAGQWTPYLRTTIKAFLAGKRAMTDGKPPRLRAFAQNEGDAGMDALMDYYASQQ